MILQFFVEKKENLTNSTLQTQSLKKVIHKKFLKINERGVVSNQTMMSGKLPVKNLKCGGETQKQVKGAKKGGIDKRTNSNPIQAKKATVFLAYKPYCGVNGVV